MPERDFMIHVNISVTLHLFLETLFLLLEGNNLFAKRRDVTAMIANEISD